MSDSDPTAAIVSAVIAIASAEGRASSTVTILPPRRTRSAGRTAGRACAPTPARVVAAKTSAAVNVIRMKVGICGSPVEGRYDSRRSYGAVRLKPDTTYGAGPAKAGHYVRTCRRADVRR